MRFVVDENVDRSTVEMLRTAGHDVWYVAETRSGVSDEVVLGEANRRSAVLVTADTDFGRIVVRLGRASHGVLLVRFEGVPMHLRRELVGAVVRSRGESLLGCFTVVDRSGVRQRSISG